MQYFQKHMQIQNILENCIVCLISVCPDRWVDGCESFRRTVGNVSVHPEGFDRRRTGFMECWCVFKVWSTFLFGENGKSRVFLSTERDTESPQKLNQTPAVYTQQNHNSFQSLYV